MISTDNIISLNNLKSYEKQKLKIGILGGSFDPPHEGHIHISVNAIEKLNLNEVWWSVAVQNPLKPSHMYSFNERVEKSSELTKSSKYIKILTIENELNIILTVDLFSYLTKNLPEIELYFLIGADIVTHIHEWEGFDEIIKMAKIIIFSRPKYSELVKDSAIMKKYASSGIVSFVEIDGFDISSTQIRSLVKCKNSNLHLNKN